MTGQRLDLQNYIPALLTFVSNKLSHGASTTYRRLFGVGVTEWRILSLLALEPSIPAQRICFVIGFDKALVSRTVRALEAQGYVTVRPDAKDSRRTVIALTARGLELHDRIIAVALERERLLLDGMSERDRKTLIRLLHDMHRRIDTVNAYRPADTSKSKRGKSRPER